MRASERKETPRKDGAIERKQRSGNKRQRQKRTREPRERSKFRPSRGEPAKPRDGARKMLIRTGRQNRKETETEIRR